MDKGVEPSSSSMKLQPGRRWQDQPSEEKYRNRRFGDRRQELVFIGQNMKEIEIRKALDDALLSEQEFVISFKARHLRSQDKSGETIAHAAKKARTH